MAETSSSRSRGSRESTGSNDMVQGQDEHQFDSTRQFEREDGDQGTYEQDQLLLAANQLPF